MDPDVPGSGNFNYDAQGNTCSRRKLQDPFRQKIILGWERIQCCWNESNSELPKATDVFSPNAYHLPLNLVSLNPKSILRIAEWMVSVTFSDQTA